ncbi:MAG: serine/threonine protein kinase [Muribaculum sp.]|nr:serine/threonine protein kinase [Muribaculum sp.]
MEFLTGCFKAEGKGGVPVLRKSFLQGGRLPVAFACVLGREAAWSQTFWERWYEEEALPCCLRRAKHCVEQVRRRFVRSWRNLWDEQARDNPPQEDAGGSKPPDAAFWFAAGEECFYAWQGGAEIRLINLCFDKVHMRCLTAYSGELICRRAAFEPGTGILLGGASFFAHLSGELLRDCLAVRGMRREEQVKRRLAEAAAEAGRRGAADETAVLVVIREACPEAFRSLLKENGYRDPVPVGRGAFGKVYRVRAERGRRFFACKTAEGAEERALLRREAEVLSRLSHPLFAEYIDCVEDEECTVLVTEYIAGRDLDELLADGPLAPGQAVAFARQLAEGLRYLHEGEEPFLYRDLKPANIRVEAGGAVKLLDLGCVCRLREAGAARAGTRGYAAPEQLEGKASGRSCDVYAWGRVLERMTAGTESSAALIGLIAACTRQNPTERPQGMDAVLEALGRIPEAGGRL